MSYHASDESESSNLDQMELKIVENEKPEDMHSNHHEEEKDVDVVKHENENSESAAAAAVTESEAKREMDPSIIPSRAEAEAWYQDAAHELNRMVYQSVEEDRTARALDILSQVVCTCCQVAEEHQGNVRTGVQLVRQHGNSSMPDTQIRYANANGVAQIRYFWRYAVGVYGVLALQLDNGLAVREEEWFDALPIPERDAERSPVSQDTQVLACAADIPESQILHSCWVPDECWLGHALCVDHRAKMFVLTFRGTFYASVGMKCMSNSMQMPFMNGFAHAGLLWAARRSWNRIYPILMHHRRKSFPDYELLCTGHGLGGSVAALVTALSRENAPKLRARCYAFGPAATVSAEVVPRLKNYVHCLVADADPLPRFSLASAQALAKLALHYANHDSLNSIVKRVWAMATKGGTVSDSVASYFYDTGKVPTPEQARASVADGDAPVHQHVKSAHFMDQHLFVPGQAFSLTYSKPIRYGHRRCRMDISNATYFNEIFVEKGMLYDALPASYARSLEGIENDVALHQKIPSPRGLVLHLTDHLEKVWDNASLPNGGSPIAIWKPRCVRTHEENSFYFGFIADNANAFARYPAGDTFALLVDLDPTVEKEEEKKEESISLLAKPTGFEPVWSDKVDSMFFGASSNCNIYRPIPPPGYVQLGFVVVNSLDTPTVAMFPRLRCVHESLVFETNPLIRLWTSKGCGVASDIAGEGVSLCLIHPKNSGIHPGHTFVAIPHMDGEEDTPPHPIYWFKACPENLTSEKESTDDFGDEEASSLSTAIGISGTPKAPRRAALGATTPRGGKKVGMAQDMKKKKKEMEDENIPAAAVSEEKHDDVLSASKNAESLHSEL